MTDSDEGARLEANKRLVVDMWYDCVCGRNIDNFGKYIADDYLQHNPNAKQGLQGVIDFHRDFWPEGALKPGTYELTKFIAVLAEGNFVQLVMAFDKPHPRDPSQTYKQIWFDLYRIENGKIVEHWDPALMD